MHGLQRVSARRWPAAPGALLGLALLAAGAPAHAGIIFTPHLDDYYTLAPGEYTEGTFIYTQIRKQYDRDGNAVSAGHPFVPDGESIGAALVLMKFLWIGNLFRDTGIPVLNDHEQACRLIGVAGWEQASDRIVQTDRNAGMKSGANGLGDVFGLCGVYSKFHIWGPLGWNTLTSVTVKAPVGQFDTDNLLNIGTNYWSVMPELSWHGELFGRLYHDGTAAYQWNGHAGQPAFGGLTPTRPADIYNFEGNLAWKWTEHWFTDVGFTFFKSRGSNEYDEYTLNLKNQPVSAQTACDSTNSSSPITIIDPATCNSTNDFWLNPRPGPYYDRGISGTLLTAGMYYVYRTSSVVQIRYAMPIRGRGGQIDAQYDVCTATAGTRSSDCHFQSASPAYVNTVVSTQNAVQEAAAVSASPYWEARFVYLFWAP